MNRSACHIAILEPSKIICEGLQAILHRSEMNCLIYRPETLEELAGIFESSSVDILIVNPVLFINREKEIRKIRKSHPFLSIACIDSGMMYRPLVPADITFSLCDSPEHIVHALYRLNKKRRSLPDGRDGEETLTKREIEVLTGLVSGMLNKEIAEALSISIHTVVRHRKNIGMKTGIRSQSGLTIYAISKKIISIEDIEI
ncbi:MAG: LuxR C-terminal-related transcriptional regulator [Proteiniphilum sp.]|jgi:DNA-binding NarL/FixJ family response regulator|nr:LuxR C-terminal-related transcriptional regulator [Proteiniphilum sp.]